MTTRIRRDKSGRWELAVAPPAESLRLYVHEYVAWCDSAAGVVCHRHVPSGRIPLILNRGARVRERRAERVAWTEYESFASGLHDTFTLTESTGPNRGMQINFTALGARLFFGYPLHVIANRSVAADELLDNADALSTRLFDSSDAAHQFSLLDHDIGVRIAAARPVKRELAWAWQELVRTSGRVRIARIVADLGWSERHFAASFRTEFGLSPKTLARVFRFERAIQKLTRGRRDLADVAVSSGYYDQPHFNRDFTQFAGLPPLAFVATQSAARRERAVD